MEYFLDTADLAEIEKAARALPITGVTTNPSIIKKAGAEDFFGHLKKIQAIIGEDKYLHVQAVAETAEGMVEDAKRIVAELGDHVYVKIPTTAEGLAAMKALKKMGIGVTATVVYTKAQAFLAMEADADYIAPYFNRMENMGINSDDVISSMAGVIAMNDYNTKILAASFKNAGQVNRAIELGAQSITADPAILMDAIGAIAITDAVDTFLKDWKSLYGDKTIAEM